MNFMIPISALIVATTVLGTLSLRSVAAKQREVIVESIENILEKCQHVSAVIPEKCVEKCCDEMDKVRFADTAICGIYKNIFVFKFLQVCDTDLKRVDFYDSKFDLGALSIADLSLQSSTDSQDYAEFKHACMFLLFFQPAFAVCWFLGVVALENRESCVMPVAFIIVSNILVSTSGLLLDSFYCLVQRQNQQFLIAELVYSVPIVVDMSGHYNHIEQQLTVRNSCTV